MYNQGEDGGHPVSSKRRLYIMYTMYTMYPMYPEYFERQQSSHSWIAGGGVFTGKGAAQGLAQTLHPQDNPLATALQRLPSCERKKRWRTSHRGWPLSRKLLVQDAVAQCGSPAAMDTPPLWRMAVGCW